MSDLFVCVAKFSWSESQHYDGKCTLPYLPSWCTDDISTLISPFRTHFLNYGTRNALRYLISQRFCCSSCGYYSSSVLNSFSWLFKSLWTSSLSTSSLILFPVDTTSSLKAPSSDLSQSDLALLLPGQSFFNAEFRVQYVTWVHAL